MAISWHPPRDRLWNERCTSRNTHTGKITLGTYIFFQNNLLPIHIHLHIRICLGIHIWQFIFDDNAQGSKHLSHWWISEIVRFAMMELEVDLFCWGRRHCGKIPQMYEAKSPSQFPKADHERCLVESFYKAVVLWDIEINVWSGCIFKLELSNGLTPAILCCIIYSWAIGTHGSHQLVSASHHRLLQRKPFESI